MAKDPAALIYIANWLLQTKGMKAEEKGWYMNLILHQHWDEDNSLPSDIEELANICDVRFSEFDSFKRSFESTFKRSFQQKENGRLYNADAAEVISSRGNYKKQKDNAGKISVLCRMLRKYFTKDENIIFFIKQNIDLDEWDEFNESNLKRPFERWVELYNNKDVDKNIDTNELNKKGVLPDTNLVFGQVEKYKTEFENDYQLDQTVFTAHGFDPDQLATARLEFWSEKQYDSEMLGLPYQDVQQHFVRWCKTNKERIKRGEKLVIKTTQKELKNDTEPVKRKIQISDSV